MSAPYRVMLIIVLCTVLLLGSAPLKSTQAELLEGLIFNVDSFEDLNDYAINSVCSTGTITLGPCTLRAAISEINENLPHEDILINIPAGTYTLTLPPVDENDVHSGDLNITTADTTYYTVTIRGIDTEPAVIDANQLDRVFEIGAGVKVIMENVVIRGGLLISTGLSVVGAGIFNQGDLKLERVAIENNEVRCGLESCPTTILGGGLSNYGIVSLQDTTIRQNTADRASALYNGSSGNVTIWNSTIANNHSTNGYVILNWNTLKIRNSTLSGNTSATVDFGPALFNSGILLIESSTFANKGHNPSIRNVDGYVTIQDTIFVAEPGNQNCAGDLSPTYWTSLGYNIYNDASCPATGTGDLINTDPLLAMLGDWGGLTMTLPPQASSPAVNHRPDVCMVDGLPVNPFVVLFEDQRHEPRDDDHCDTGAFEGAVVLLKTYLPLALR